MFVRIARVRARKLASVVLVSSLAAALAGCSSDPAPDSSSGGTANGNGTGKSRDDKSTTEPDDEKGSGPGGGMPSMPGGSDDPGSGEPGPSPSKKDNGGQCEESADCKSDFCVFQGNGLGMCTTTCDGDIDCDLSWRCVKLSNAPQKVCVPE